MLPVGDYTFWDALWTMFVFFLWILWFFLLFKIIFDVFRRHDVGGGKKVLWLIFILFVPFIGVFAYIIANGDDMAKRDMDRAQAQQAQFNDYVQNGGGRQRRRRSGGRDRQGEAAARHRRDHASRVRLAEGQGAGKLAPAGAGGR